jgi:hypothetical protein
VCQGHGIDSPHQIERPAKVLRRPADGALFTNLLRARRH